MIQSTKQNSITSILRTVFMLFREWSLRNSRNTGANRFREFRRLHSRNNPILRHFQKTVRSIVTYKVNIITSLCIFLITTLTGIFSYIYQRRSIYENLSQSSEQIARHLENNLIQPIWGYNYEQIKLAFELEMEYPHVYAILFEDQEGNLVVGKIKSSPEAPD